MLINMFFLFLEVVAKKMRNSQNLMQRKAKRKFLKERQRSNEVYRVKKARLKSPRKCTCSRAPWYDYAIVKSNYNSCAQLCAP